MAKAEACHAGGRLVVVFLGDGALGEGAVYESLNMASLWRLPLLLVLENNRYAQSTPIELNLAGDIAARFEAFGIPCYSLDSTDVLEIEAAARPALAALRAGAGPQALVLHTYRFAPHSKGDDSRDPQEIAAFRGRDPLPLHAARLTQALRQEIETEVESEVAAAFESALASPPSDSTRLTPALEPTL